MGFLKCNSRISYERSQEKVFRVILLMGWYIILVIYCLSSSSFVRGSNVSDIESLNAFIHDYADKALVRYPRIGILYNISLPANFSGMEVSVIRLRSRPFWNQGAKFNFIDIPPWILPVPYATRISILYQNLGNLSSSYYDVVPGYTLVAPVVGFMAYDCSNSSKLGNQEVGFQIMGDPISIQFSHFVQEGKNTTPKCVKFRANGSFEFQNMTKPYVCVTKGQGLFSVVVPVPSKQNQEWRLRNWWRLRIGVGIVGLVLVCLAMVVIYKMARRKRISKMERQSERGVAFDTFSVGGSNMPFASMIRTQPALENDYVP